MFTHATPANATLATSTSSAQPSSPVRPSRLRGLSYLRNYTHALGHSHSRENSNAANAAANEASTRDSAEALAATTAQQRRLSLSRTTSYPSAGGIYRPQIQSQPASATVPTFQTSMATQVAPVTHAIARSEEAQLQPLQIPIPASAMVSNTINSAGQWLAEPRRNPGLPSVTNGDQVSTAPTQQSATAPFSPETVRPQPLRALSRAGQAALRETGSDAPAVNGNGGNTLMVVNNPSPPPSLDIRPTIKFSQHQDARAPRPSLMFTPMGRTLPTGTEIVKVGRYSERETAPNQPANMSTAAPVGFKSKVVSRRHCEFWVENGQWYIKDVKSSSGTFLNHVRLSPPNTESRPYPVKDGDIVQLGIDFKGGEEMIFRCVKIRVEVNRGWQAGLNQFNVASHRQLKRMTKAGGEGTSSSDCSICLSAVAPCQALFVAPCSHTWHYKCIRPVLDGPQFPHFSCPNCRAVADLDADVDEPTEGEWEELDFALEQSQAAAALPAPTPIPVAVPAAVPVAEEELAQLSRVDAPPPYSLQSGAATRTPPDAHDQELLALHELALTSPGTPHNRRDHSTRGGSRSSSSSSRRPLAPSSFASRPHDLRPSTTHLTSPIPISNRRSGEARGRESPERSSEPQDNPMTPRNDAGPFIFDGSALSLNGEGNGSNPLRNLRGVAGGSGGSGGSEAEVD